MGVLDAPAWVLAAWRRSLQDVGATAGQANLESYGQRMIERWSGGDRIHHNLRRLIAVLARVDELSPETHDPDVVRLAAWYHGAVFNAAAQHAYARRGGVDEPASAELARTELTELGVPPDVVNRVAELILGIARHTAPKGNIDAQALCDADLGALAVEPQRYAAYRKEVRAEYAHIPQRDYLSARVAIVTKLLARRQLFQSPMAQAWEDPARENLTAELERISAELAALAGAEPADHDGDPHGGQAGSPEQGVGEAEGGAAVPAVPEEVDLPDGGPGPAGFVPREVGEPGAAGLDETPQATRPGGSDDASGGQPRGPEATERPGSSGQPGVGERPGAGAPTTDPEQVDARGSSARDASFDGPIRDYAPIRGSQRADDRWAAVGYPASSDGRRPASPARPTPTSAPSPVENQSADLAADQPETLAQRCQRQWQERQAAWERPPSAAGQAALRRGDSAPSPLDPGVGPVSSPAEPADADAEELDETSSLSRPPRMPAIKHRPREAGE